MNELDIIKETEVVLRKFLKEQKFPIDTMSLEEIHNEFKRRGMALRCEWFFKNMEPDGEDYMIADAVAIPWIEKIGQHAARADVYRDLKLKEKGYIL